MDPQPPTDTFVDVTYRGLEVGRRAKLTDVAADAGFVEVAAPMPVGSTVVLATDDGVAITAEVCGVHEQVAGTERPPGMRVAPRLEGAAVAWWAQRVTIASAPPAERRTRELTARAHAAAHAIAERDREHSGTPAVTARRTRIMAEGEIKEALSVALAEEQKLGLAAGAKAAAAAVPTAPPAAAGAADDGKPTEIMAAVDQELLAKLTGDADFPIVDDGRRTIRMETFPIGLGDGDPDGTDDGDGVIIEEQKPTPSGRMPVAKVKPTKRRKRR